METTVKLYTLGYSRVKTYVTALLFVAGNIVLPQLFHLVPQGGVTWLPIYFFTLVGAYKYGWKAGLLTAGLSPLLHSAQIPAGWQVARKVQACHPAEICAVGCGCRSGGRPLSESHLAVAVRRGVVLSTGWYVR